MTKLFFLHLITLLLSSHLFAQSTPSSLTLTEQVSLTWDASGGDVTGYKLYIGTSPRSYRDPISVGNQTHFTVQGLTSGTYYFSVKAFNATGDSDYSNEVSKTIPVTLPIGAYISAVSVSAISPVSATITWVTNQDCSGLALYGTDINNLKSVTSNNLGTTDHLAIIPSLLPRTHYVFKVRSICNGQTVESENRSFNTK